MGRHVTMRRATALGVVAVLLLALIDLALPFTGDQSLFAVAASGLAHGDVYYRDIWDIKQPGIYAFYTVDGAVFGYGEVGIHVGELVLLGGLAIAIGRALRRLGTTPAVAVGIPVALVGTYYATTPATDLTLLEIQVSAIGLLAIVLLLVGLAADGPLPRRSAVGIGVALGAVAWLKLLTTIPVLGALVAVAIVLRGRRWTLGREGFRALWLPAGAVSLGMTVGWMAYLARYVGWDELLETTFSDPRGIAGLPGLHTADLAVEFVKSGARRFGPLVPLAVVAILRRNRDRSLESLRVGAVA